MLRRHQAFFGRLYMALDIILLMVAYIGAWLIRFKTTLLPQYPALPFADYSVLMFFSIPGFLIFAVLFGLYGTLRTDSLRFVGIQLVKSVIVMTVWEMSIAYFNKQFDYSRAVVVIYGFFAVVLLFSGRFIVRTVLKKLRVKGYNQKFVVFVGLKQSTVSFIERIMKQPELGYQVLGYVLEDQDSEVGKKEVGHLDQLKNDLSEHGVYCLGTLQELDEVVSRLIIDHLVITLSDATDRELMNVLGIASSHGVHAILVPQFLDLLPSRPRFDEFAGIPIVDTHYAPLDEMTNAILKRAFDIVFSFGVLTLGSPIFILIALLVKITSSGPVIYSQERVGKNRRTFRMYKFRTMNNGDDEDGEKLWTTPDDPRRTNIGSFLRSSSLDELPQFFNVLRGDMSIIGPRPERPYFVDHFRQDIPKYMLKHRVRPGITGWAQVNGLRGDTSIEDRIEYDLHYIEDWTFSWDIRIVLLTVMKGLRNRNAY